MSSQSTLLLMVGGLAMKADELIPLGDSLAAQGVRSVFFDNLFVGDGPRPKELSALTIEDQARHHWSLIDSLGIPASEKISIFGISMGGMIAASMAVLRKNQVEKLFLAATSANLPEKPAIGDKLYAEWMNAKSPEVLERAVTIAFGKTCLKNKKEIKDEYLRYRLMAENKQSGKDFVMQIHSIRNFPGESCYRALALSEIPVTIITGEEDVLFPESHANDIRTLLPKAKTISLKSTGHMLHLENKAQLCDAILKACEISLNSSMP